MYRPTAENRGYPPGIGRTLDSEAKTIYADPLSIEVIVHGRESRRTPEELEQLGQRISNEQGVRVLVEAPSPFALYILTPEASELADSSEPDRHPI
jgi:hypothetical protein